MRTKKRMTNGSSCPRCGVDVESAIHVVRDCCFAKDVWMRWLSGRQHMVNFFGVPLKEWLRRNCSSKALGDGNVWWKFSFIMTIWSLWKSRNDVVFQHRNQSASVVWSVAARWASEVMVAASQNLMAERRVPVWVGWVPAEQGVVILNCDGAVKASTSLASAGGLLRDSNGHWVSGFMVNIGYTHSLMAELWGVREGLILAKSLEIQALVVELDAAIVVQFLKDGVDGDHPCFTIVEDCRLLMQGAWIKDVRHIFREGNKCADKLANLAQECPPGVHVMEEEPPTLTSFLLDDRLGLKFLRC